MDAITNRTPVFFVKIVTDEPNPTNKKYNTRKSSNQKEEKDDLAFASMFIDVMAATIKQLGKQVKSLQKENNKIKHENVKLRERLEDQNSKELDLVA